VAVIVLAIILFSGNGGHKYTLIFHNAGQLVNDNQVLIGGSPVGTVESIGLSDDNLAEIHVEVDQPLHEGTTATIRATSLSGVANHYVSISPGPNSNPELDEGAELGLAYTTTPVDIDQLFNTFPPAVRRGLADFIQGNAKTFENYGEAANQSYKYFGPALNRTSAFLGELNSDQRLLERFIISSSKLTTAVAGRGEQLSSAIANANTAFSSIASQNEAFDQTLQRLPPQLVTLIRRSNGADAATITPYVLSIGRSVMTALAAFFGAWVLALYLLIERDATYDWVRGFVPLRHRARFDRTCDEAAEAAQGYVVGNFVTSVFAGIYVFAWLRSLAVPAALLLALLAFIVDFIPVLGFYIAVIPAMAMAATVSASLALAMIPIYLAYHVIENYLIGPRVYGNRLRLSTLAVLLAFAVGAELAGVLGALLALPLAVLYPTIEKLWLRRALGDEVVEAHARTA